MGGLILRNSVGKKINVETKRLISLSRKLDETLDLITRAKENTKSG